MNRAYAFVSPAQIPQPNGSIDPDEIGLPGVTSLTSQILPTLVGAQISEAEFIEALYTPTNEDLAPLEGYTYRLYGWVRHRLHLPPSKGRPVVFFVYGPCYEVEDDGVSYRWAPLPQGFDPDLHIHAELNEMIIALLGRCSVADCVRWTLVPARTIEIIRDCLDSWQRDAMRLGGARPDHVAVTRVRLQGDAGDLQEVLHVIAAERDTGRAWTLAVLDLALGADDLAACLSEELTNLPQPETVSSVVTSAEPTVCKIVREALAMQSKSRRGYAAKLVIAGSDDVLDAETESFAGAVAQLDRRLEALAQETSLAIDHLEKRALVRQGYNAKLCWPLILPTPRSGCANRIPGPPAALHPWLCSPPEPC